MVSDIPAGNGNIEKLFLRWMCAFSYWTLKVDIAGGLHFPIPKGLETTLSTITLYSGGGGGGDAGGLGEDIMILNQQNRLFFIIK